MDWLEHLIEGCVGERRSGRTRNRLLDESGDGIKEIKVILRKKTV